MDSEIAAYLVGLDDYYNKIAEFLDSRQRAIARGIKRELGKVARNE